MVDIAKQSADDKTNSEGQIFAEQIRLLYDSTYLACFVQAVVISTLTLALRDFVPTAHIMAVLALFAVAILSRLYLKYRYQKSPPSQGEVKKWADLYTVSVAFNGLGWMIAAYVFISTSEPTNLVFTALVLGGISSGGLISLATHLPSYYVLMFPTMLGGIGLYLQNGTSISLYTAALGFLLMIFLFVSAKRLNALLVSNISLSLEYNFLFSDLAKEKSNTDALNENLKSEVSERRLAEDKSRHAMEQAEMANNAKSDFLSSMSHELRTPLNAIMGYGQLLEHTSKDLKQSKYVDEILRGGRHLLTLINQVLDLAKIEQRQMEISIASAKPEEIIDDAIAMAEIQAISHGIKIKFHRPKKDVPLIKVDQTRVLQVLLNILSNAIKYNVPDGQVTVSIKEIEAKPSSQFVRITVADTGKGIPADSHDEIFEPFNRLAYQSSSIEGSGIGLSICKLLMELMDGKIDFQSSEGEGSVFWIDLPIDLDGFEAQQASDQEKAPKKLRG